MKSFLISSSSIILWRESKLDFSQIFHFTQKEEKLPDPSFNVYTPTSEGVWRVVKKLN